MNFNIQIYNDLNQGTWDNICGVCYYIQRCMSLEIRNSIDASVRESGISWNIEKLIEQKVREYEFNI